MGGWSKGLCDLQPHFSFTGADGNLIKVLHKYFFKLTQYLLVLPSLPQNIVLEWIVSAAQERKDGHPQIDSPFLLSIG